MKTVWVFLIVFLRSGSGGKVEQEFPHEEFQKIFAKAACDFALDLIKTSCKEDEENLVVSPSSIGVLLAILQQGAGGNTAVQIEKVLRLQSESSNIGYGHLVKFLQEEKANLTLEWGNKAFVTPEFNISEIYLKNIQESFNANFEKLDFKSFTPAEAATKINDWVKEVTHDRVQDLVDASLLSSDIVMIMANAIFFKSFWDSPFPKYKTRLDIFHVNQESKTEIPFMRQEGRFPAGEDSVLDAKWVELPFKDGNISMIFVLPFKENGINSTMNKMEGKDLLRIINNEDTRRVKIEIPKFKISKKISLMETLKELGLTDVFSKESNLKGISQGEESLRLSQLIHQAEVEIDEDGGSAAAATFEIVQTLSLEWFTDELNFKLDRPFLFFIADKANQVPIFADCKFLRLLVKFAVLCCLLRCVKKLECLTLLEDTPDVSLPYLACSTFSE